MQTKIVFGLLAALALGNSAQAQVFSQNIVGYVNQTLYAGDNLIANQLATADDTLDTIFQPGVPEGATFTEWDVATQEFLPTSTYDTVNGWSINYELGYGMGGLFNTPSTFVNTFEGTVWPGFNGTQPFVPPVVSGSGMMLLSCMIPIDSATFYDVVGRDPENGESVMTLDGPSQTMATTTFNNGTWSDGAPDLGVGEAAFFNLDPASGNIFAQEVPEPGIQTLLAAGLLIMLPLQARRYWRVKSVGHLP